MPNLTLRDIPADILEKIRILSLAERRSINSEVLFLLENGLKQYISEIASAKTTVISKETQLDIWSNISGGWQDDRETGEITDEIYSRRTMGREVDL